MSSQANVLFLASWYPTTENPTHGIFIQNHAKALALYTPVTVVYAYSTHLPTTGEIQIKKEGNLTELILPYPKSKLDLPFLKQYSQFSNFKLAYKLLLEKLIQLQIKVKAIQVNVAFPASIALPLFIEHFKVKHTIMEHWSGYLKEDGNYRGTVMRHFTKKCFNHCSKIYYVSERQKESLIHHGLSGNFELIYNAIDTSIFKPLPTETKTRTTFLHVSSLVEREKNLSGTFKALKIIQDKGFDVELVIIGGNADSIKDSKVLQNEIGLNNVTYLGYKTKNEIAEQMNKSDALILFSNFEGMPVVALEALACGLPVLASDVGQLPNMITSKFGKLAQRNNIEEFAIVLEQFIAGKFTFDKTKMREFILQHASYEAVGKQLQAYYQTV